MRTLVCLIAIVMIFLPSAAFADGVTPQMIGGVGMTHLTVYEQRPAPDGVMSGCPHIHGLTDEAYYVISGKGRAELHDAAHGFRTVELTPGQYLQFPPLVMHRIISEDKLVILAIMGNAGLPENGDARIYFGKETDTNPEKYTALVSLAKEQGLEGALARRDAAVEGYLQLMELWKTDKDAYYKELDRFTKAHLSRLAEEKNKFGSAVESGPLYWGTLSKNRLESLPAGKVERDIEFHDGNPKIIYGMCGVLRPVNKLEPVATP